MLARPEPADDRADDRPLPAAHQGQGAGVSMPSTPTQSPPDLVEKLTEAATAAIRNERPSLEHQPETVKGLTVEIVVGKDGRPGDVVVYLERRTQGGALLGRHAGEAAS